MRRRLTSHKVNECNDQLEVEVLDGPGAGNACHLYQIGVPLLNPAEHHVAENVNRMKTQCRVSFQDGPIKESGVNGVTHESLLAIVEHRLQGFQAGEYACRENAIALTKIQEAMMWLQKRTRDRQLRGVEGTHEK